MAEDWLRDDPAIEMERLQVARISHAFRTDGRIRRRGTAKEQTRDINPSIHLKTETPME
jgi:hypothetical protein